MDGIGDLFTDAIAFARCVARDDLDGQQAIMALSHPIDLLVSQSWIVNACVARLSNELELTVDEVWAVLLESVEIMKDNTDNESDEDD